MLDFLWEKWIWLMKGWEICNERKQHKQRFETLETPIEDWNILNHRWWGIFEFFGDKIRSIETKS